MTSHVTSLSLARIGFGTAAWVAPRLGLRAALLDATHPQAPFLMRAFGIRDVALGALTLVAQDEHRALLLKVGLAVDASDAVAGLLLWRSGAVKASAGALLTGAAVSAVVTGAAALAQEH